MAEMLDAFMEQLRAAVECRQAQKLHSKDPTFANEMRREEAELRLDNALDAVRVEAESRPGFRKWRKR